MIISNASSLNLYLMKSKNLWLQIGMVIELPIMEVGESGGGTAAESEAVGGAMRDGGYGWSILHTGKEEVWSMRSPVSRGVIDATAPLESKS